MTRTIDWTHRWMGGFCALAAVGGMPIRAVDYAAHPPLEQALTLPAVLPAPTADMAQATAAWSAALGGASVLLLRSADRARALLRSAGLAEDTPVGLPANVTRDLLDQVKRSARPLLLNLDADLRLIGEIAHVGSPSLIWDQPAGGLTTPTGLPSASLWVDTADTLPDANQPGRTPRPDVTIYGLHLATDPNQAGALLVFAQSLDGHALYERLLARLAASDQPDAARAMAQCRRLIGQAGRPGLAERQQAALAETWRGLHDAAGLDLLPLRQSGGLAHGVAVRIPDECDVATFYAYVRAEGTPVRWLPEMRPLHYAAIRDGDGAYAATAAHLARWLLVPVGPDYTDEEIKHAVLGIVKAAEYLGMRWRTDPARAAEYAAMMDELYGLNHDAYRPAFSIPTLAHV